MFGAVGGVECEQQGYGICPAGEGGADAVSGVDVGAVEGERGRRHRVHVICWVRLVQNFYTGAMFETRLATGADAELIGQQRRRMFVDMGEADDARMQMMVEKFVPWVRERTTSGAYIGWLVLDEGKEVAGGGMWLTENPPNLMDIEPQRAHLLNFYVEPAYRGRGLAYGLLKTAVGEARRRGIKVVTLHASKFGRPLYERNGFEATNEMRLWNRE